MATLNSHLVISEQLAKIDLVIVFLCLGAFLLVPRLLDRKKRAESNDHEYLLMSKGLTLPLFVATLTSTWYGGIFGVTQIAYQNGIYSFVTQGLFWYVAYFIFALVMAKKIRQHKVRSLPELIGQKFGEKARRLSALVLFFHALPITYGISVGVLLKLALGIDFFWVLVLGVLIVGIYTSMGGFRSVVVTDCLQFVLMFIAVIMALWVCVMKYGGMTFLTTALPPHYFTWQGEHHISQALIWLFIACTSTFIHPVFYQRCLAAKSDRTAILGVLIAMGFWLVFDMCTTFGGMYARALLPDADSATAYLSMGLQLLPNGLRGIFLSGILATILSTLDSFMFVSGTSISYDLITRKHIFKGYEHHIAIFSSAGLVIMLGSMFETNFEATWLFMEGAFSTSMLMPALACIFLKKKFKAHVFFIPVLGTLLAFGVATYLQRNNFLSIDAFYIAHGCAFLLFVTFSGLARPPANVVKSRA